jgi:hypothetical protein
VTGVTAVTLTASAPCSDCQWQYCQPECSAVSLTGRLRLSATASGSNMMMVYHSCCQWVCSEVLSNWQDDDQLTVDSKVEDATGSVSQTRTPAKPAQRRVRLRVTVTASVLAPASESSVNWTGRPGQYGGRRYRAQAGPGPEPAALAAEPQSAPVRVGPASAVPLSLHCQCQ